MDGTKTTERNLDAPETTLLLTREFNASPELLFRMWTQPEHIVRWWGCGKTEGLDFTNDLRVGGEFSALMRLDEGGSSRIWGVYCKIEEPTLLSFTWSWEGSDGFCGEETLVTITMVAKGDKTELTLRHESFADADACKGHGEGWSMSLDRLAGYLVTA